MIVKVSIHRLGSANNKDPRLRNESFTIINIRVMFHKIIVSDIDIPLAKLQGI